MSDVLGRWNRLSDDEAAKEIVPCCGSRSWARGMADRRPISSEMDLLNACDAVCGSLAESDWNEAFQSHPRIGESRAAGPSTSRSEAWSGEEQGRVATAVEQVKLALAQANQEYEERFKRIFIVCATGKPATEILEILRRRLHNDDATEFREAAEEQRKIARLRLKKWLVHAESKKVPLLRSG
jgi:2-oxo-4-hydroxy-4-carboxy-5-ureidoimidazoline decarboxylase